MLLRFFSILTAVILLVFVSGCESPITNQTVIVEDKSALILPSQGSATLSLEESPPPPESIDEAADEAIDNIRSEAAAIKDDSPSADNDQQIASALRLDEIDIDPATTGIIPVISTNPSLLDPEKFIGGTLSSIKPILGRADFIRQEGSMHIWQYRQTHCVVDLFIQTFGQPDTSQAQIIAVDMRARILAGDLDKNRCYEELQNRRR